MTTPESGNDYGQDLPVEITGTTKTAESTTWSQKHLHSVNESANQLSTVQEWAYLAQGRAGRTQVSEDIFTQTHSECFCDHSAIPVDFSNLEHIDLDHWRFQMDAIAHEFGEEFRKVFLALANNLAYHWGNCTKALFRSEHGRLMVDKAIARTAIHTPALMKCALTSIRDYMDEHWGLNITRTTLTRWLKDKLDGLGIVHWWSVVAGGKKPRHWHINMPAMLLLAEACERRILADARMEGASHGEEMAVLPEHRGYSLKLLFDAVFPGFGWNREGDQDEAAPTTYAETDEHHNHSRRVELVDSEASPEVAEHKEQLSALEQVVETVRRFGWVDRVVEQCDRMAARWGPKWGVEAMYELTKPQWKGVSE